MKQKTMRVKQKTAHPSALDFFQRKRPIPLEKQLVDLLQKEDYVEIAMLGDEVGKDKIVKCVFPAMTKLDNYKYLSGYLKRRGLLPGFLIHASASLAREAIIEFKWGNDYHIYDFDVEMALKISFRDDHQDRIVVLLDALQERYASDERFKRIGQFKLKNICIFRFDPLRKLPLETSKQFLTLHGEEFASKYPDHFRCLCNDLVRYLEIYERISSITEKTLSDWAGQHFPQPLSDFIMGTEHVGSRPKHELEEEWLKRNAPIFLGHLLNLLPDLLPKVLLNIVSQYAVTWVVV